MNESAPASTSGRRWAASVAVAAALHAAAVGACFVRFSNAPPDATLATAIAMDMAPLPTAPPLPEHDVPTPQQTDAPVPKPKKTPAVKPLPFTPPPQMALSDTKPEVVLSTQPERSQETKISTPPSADQNTRAAAPDLPPDKKIAAPNDGGYNRGDTNPEMLWYSQVMGKVQKLKRYPMLARVRNEQDSVDILMVIDRAGKLVSVQILSSSGFDLLDKESLDVARRAAPFPQPPAEVAGDTIKVSIVVQFAMGAGSTVLGVTH